MKNDINEKSKLFISYLWWSWEPLLHFASWFSGSPLTIRYTWSGPPVRSTWKWFDGLRWSVILRFLSWDQLKSLPYDWPYLTESNKLKHAIRHVFIMAQNERRLTRAPMKHAACSVSARTSSEIIKYDFLII
jgi:hypothetical protein